MTDIAEQHYRELCHDLQAEVKALEGEVERLREAIAEVRDTLEQDGRFPNAVPALSAALEGKP